MRRLAHLLATTALTVGLVGFGAFAPAATAAVPATESAAAVEPMSHCREDVGHPTLRRGKVSREVSHAQCLLKYHWNQGIAVDWKFGSATENAVRKVQRFCGLADDGVIGTQTWKVLHYKC